MNGFKIKTVSSVSVILVISLFTHASPVEAEVKVTACNPRIAFRVLVGEIFGMIVSYITGSSTRAPFWRSVFASSSRTPRLERGIRTLFPLRGIFLKDFWSPTVEN